MITREKLPEHPTTRLHYAREGEVYDIGRGRLNVGFFYRRDSEPEEGEICFLAGAKVVFASIPPSLQKEFGVGETATAVCIEENRFGEDVVQFENGKRAFVSHFANLGVTATLAKSEGASAPEAAEAGV